MGKECVKVTIPSLTSNEETCKYTNNIFTNFSFWCNFEGCFDLDVESVSNLLFFIVPEMANVLIATTFF